MSRFLTTLGLLALISSVTTAIDDSTCSYKWSKLRCMPEALCSFQYRFGDWTPDQSCRVRSGVNKLPQQMHLAFAGEVTGTGMTVSWATFAKVEDSAVWIGTTVDTLIRRDDVHVASNSYYSEGSYSLWQYHGTVSRLTPNTKYYYRVGSASDLNLRTEVSSFTTARASNDPTPFDIPMYGDLGFKAKIGFPSGTASISYLHTLADKIPFVYHVGDIGYADDDFLDPSQTLGFFYEEVYNQWMNTMTPLMNKVPYMVTVGNHEAECHSAWCQLSQYKKDHLGNYTAYNARFKMPSMSSEGTQNMWYSFEYGPIHFTSISSETDYEGAPTNQFTLTHKNGQFGNQLAWVEADLKKAAANRANVPWLVVGMHRPMYSRIHSDSKGNPTDDSANLQRAFEALFIKYGVDLVVAGHVHRYERQLPIAQGQPMRPGVSDDQKVYTNPTAPVYLITGGPGNPEPNKLSPNRGTIPWNVVESSEYGITMMHVTRESLGFKYIRSKDQVVIDEFKITKG